MKLKELQKTIIQKIVKINEKLPSKKLVAPKFLKLSISIKNI